MKIGFTGTRDGTTSNQFAACTEFFLTQQVSEFHHGDCTGADEDIHNLVTALKIQIYKYPGNIKKYNANTAGGIIASPPDMHPIKRNHLIVDAVDMLLACPKSQHEVLRSGTWATIRYARKVGKPIWILFPNGEIKKEGSIHS